MDLDLTKRQQEIFDFIKRYSAKTAIRRRCATSARPSAWPRPRRCTRTSPTSRSSGCCGAIRPSRGRSSCSTARSSTVKSLVARPDGPAARRPVAAGSPILAEENIEEYVTSRARRRRGGRVRPARPRRVDEGRRHPPRATTSSSARRRPRPTARSSSRSSARRRRSSASSARPTTSACSPRTRRWSRSAPRTSACWAGSSASSGACRDGPVAALERPACTCRPVPREGRTLEDLLSGAWEDLSADRTATCPICDGALELRYGSGPSAVGGRCRECRTHLTLRRRPAAVSARGPARGRCRRRGGRAAAAAGRLGLGDDLRRWRPCRRVAGSLLPKVNSTIAPMRYSAGNASTKRTMLRIAAGPAPSRLPSTRTTRSYHDARADRLSPGELGRRRSRRRSAG